MRPSGFETHYQRGRDGDGRTNGKRANRDNPVLPPNDSHVPLGNIVDAIVTPLTGSRTRSLRRAWLETTTHRGGRVESLTEAVMGITTGLYEVASAINNLADADARTKITPSNAAVAADGSRPRRSTGRALPGPFLPFDHLTGDSAMAMDANDQQFLDNRFDSVPGLLERIADTLDGIKAALETPIEEARQAARSGSRTRVRNRPRATRLSGRRSRTFTATSPSRSAFDPLPNQGAPR